MASTRAVCHDEEGKDALGADDAKQMPRRLPQNPPALGAAPSAAPPRDRPPLVPSACDRAPRRASYVRSPESARLTGPVSAADSTGAWRTVLKKSLVRATASRML